MKRTMDNGALWRSLERSRIPIAGHLCSNREEVNIEVFAVAAYSDLFETLKARANIKQKQIECARTHESRSRFEKMRSALQSVVAWWQEHPEVDLRHAILTLPPDVCFMLWFRNDTGDLLGGFESRNGLKLSYSRGKEFFGQDWEPTPDPNFP